MAVRCLIVLLLLLAPVSDIKAVQYAYEVRFADKSGTISFSDSLSYLSRRALDRRARMGLSIDSTDLPVATQYLDSVVAISGGKIHLTSRWLNLCVLLVEDTSGLARLRSRPFVVSVVQVAAYRDKLHKGLGKNEGQPQPAQKTTAGYGLTLQQTRLVNGNYLHDRGYMGQGMLIAVLDAGFIDVNVMPAFAAMRREGRLRDVYNFVLDTSFIYAYDNHGSKVLSTIAGYLPDTFVGSAPMASFALYISEDKSSEQPIEMWNMLAATERADSIGADVLSSSLGYNEFDSVRWNLNFARDLDGKTTVAAQAANMASAKGLLFVTSAGNEGTTPWRKILTPGDADSALTIGSVDISSTPATSSGYGPNAAGQVKPDVCALGRYAAIVSPGGLGSEDGTSFATPQIAGWAACLIQAAPRSIPAAIRQSITRCASEYLSPGPQLGYGVPDFSCSATLLSVRDTAVRIDKLAITVVNPIGSKFEVKIVSPSAQTIHFRLMDMAGRLVASFEEDFSLGSNPVFVKDAAQLPTGIYLLNVSGAGFSRQVKLLKR